MEKDYGLQCIDYAVSKTIERSFQNPDLKKMNSTSHLSEAIVEYMFKGNATGFSSNGDGRKYIKGLSREDFEEQLLKHVVKSDVAKTNIGAVQLLGMNKSFGQDLTCDEAQQLIFKSFNEMDMTAIKYLLDKYPTLYKALAVNFVDDRYFNGNLGPEVLDSVPLDYQHAFHYNKIEEYYKQLRNNKEENFQL